MGVALAAQAGQVAAVLWIAAVLPCQGSLMYLNIGGKNELSIAQSLDTLIK